MQCLLYQTCITYYVDSLRDKINIRFKHRQDILKQNLIFDGRLSDRSSFTAPFKVTKIENVGRGGEDDWINSVQLYLILYEL